MTVYALIAPKQQWEDANGNPYVGAKLFTYVAGSTTKKTSYTEADGLTPNTNPIILNSRGEAANNVFGSTGPYKLVLAPSTDTDPPLSPYWTVDNWTGANDISVSTDQWIPSGMTPTYISATSFSVIGDQTSILSVDRRLKITLGGGVVYSTILTSSFGAGITTVTVINDSTVIDNTISAFSYGIISKANGSVVSTAIRASIATTSGSTAQFTSIPSWVKKITFSLVGVSTDTGDSLLIQLGDSGGIETTGYLGVATLGANATAPDIDAVTTGFGIKIGAATAIVHGSLVISLVNPATFTWAAQGAFARSDSPRLMSTAGSKPLSAALDRIRLVTTGGAVFDAGEVNVLLE